METSLVRFVRVGVLLIEKTRVELSRGTQLGDTKMAKIIPSISFRYYSGNKYIFTFDNFKSIRCTDYKLSARVPSGYTFQSLLVILYTIHDQC